LPGGTSSWRRPSLREVQIGPRIIPGVGFVVKGSLADTAGFQDGDLVTEINGIPVFNLSEMGPIIDANRGKDVVFGVERNGQEFPLSMKLPPATPDALPVNFGIEWGRSVLVHPSPLTQVKDAATSIFRMVGALLSPASDVKAAHFSGPVGIMRLYYQIFEVVELIVIPN
jgi:regulator of sigma E protease